MQHIQECCILQQELLLFFVRACYNEYIVYDKGDKSLRHSTDALDLVVDRIMQNMSFDHASFSEAVLTITVDAAPELKLTFDRLSMKVYSHNLEDDEFSYVIKNLRSRYQEEHSREELKSMAEYNVLLDFFLLHQEYNTYNIAKETRPDFVLSGDRRIGIEVTEFTTEVDSVLAAIANRNFGQDKTANEIHESAHLKHGSKADRYSYRMIAGSASIGAPLTDVRANKSIYADEIIKKYNKYCGVFSEYDEFIVLCDARYSINVTEWCDSKEVIEMAKEKCSSLSGFAVVILRLNPLCQPEADIFNL